jgi:hypothetical protein
MMTITHRRFAWAARVRLVLGAILLLLQVGAVIHARFVPSRYFCWAPHDSQSEYRIEVLVGGRALPDEAIERRYQLSPSGVEARSIQLVLDSVRQYEETYGRADGARAVVKYRINGGEERQWQWTAP